MLIRGDIACDKTLSHKDGMIFKKEEHMSTIWKTEIKHLGGSTDFNSEYEMETFLMLNPEIVDCGGGDDEYYSLWQQIQIEKKYKKNGRIDLIGIGEKESEEGSGEKVLKIFELKNGEIDKNAIDQLKGYMEAIKDKKGAASSKIKDVLKGRSTYTDKEIDVLIESAEGVLVGTSFKYDKVNIGVIEEEKFKVIKIMRFAGESGDQYIILEDVVGNTVKRGQVKKFSWEELKNGDTMELKNQVKGYEGNVDHAKKFINSHYEAIKTIADSFGINFSKYITSGPNFTLIYNGEKVANVYLRQSDYDFSVYVKLLSTAPGNSLLEFKGEKIKTCSIKYDEPFSNKKDSIKTALEHSVEWIKRS